METINPKKTVTVSKDLLSINIDDYKKNVTYGELGEAPDTNNTNLKSKLNHRVNFTNKDENIPYEYDFEGTEHDVNAYNNITKTNASDDIGRRRESISIGVLVDGTSYSLNGDVTNKEKFNYNAGNVEEYSSADFDGSVVARPTKDGTKFFSLVTDENGEIKDGQEVNRPVLNNISNTLSKTMNYYRAVVKPLSARE